MPALGERFRAAREARGLSLSDVAEQIRIRSVYLAAIEEENWGTIGAPVYVRGFLRTYARFLGLDPEEVVAAFSAAQPAGSVTARGEDALPPSSAALGKGTEWPAARSSLLIWFAATVAVLMVGFVAYNELTMRQQASAPVAAASSVASPAPSNAVAAAVAAPTLPPSPGASASPVGDGPNSLALLLSATSWLRVTVDGSVSMEGTFPAGTSKTFHGRNAMVRVGNAGGVEIYVDGKNVGKLGKSGDVVERAFTL